MNWRGRAWRTDCQRCFTGAATVPVGRLTIGLLIALLGAGVAGPASAHSTTGSTAPSVVSVVSAVSAVTIAAAQPAPLAPASAPRQATPSRGRAGSPNASDAVEESSNDAPGEDTSSATEEPLSGDEARLGPVALLNGSAHVLVVAFVVTLICTPLARRLALARGVVDRPDEARKIHRRPIPYLGGLAVFAGVLAALVVSWTIPGLETSYRGVPMTVVIGMVAIMLTGLGDDVFGWDPRTKIAGQLVAAAALTLDDIGTRAAEGILTPLFGASEHQLFELLGEAFLLGDVYYWVGVIGTAVLVLGACNAANFIDGLDGLLSGVTGFVALGMLVIALMLVPTYSAEPVPDDGGRDAAATRSALVDGASAARNAVSETARDAARNMARDGADPPAGGDAAGRASTDSDGQPAVDAADAALPAAGGVRPGHPRDLPVARVILALAVLGAVLGFLPWNFNPAVIFLGDCGSLMLGYLCAVMILMLGDRGQTHYVIAGLIVFGLPIMDTMLAIVRRRLAGVSMSAADDQHIHHQVRRGMGSVRRAVLVLYSISAVFSLVGVLLVALVLADVRARAIYAVAIVLFGFIGVLALKSARHQAPPAS
ncbi:MAG: glycosyltransferase family 4 protein [Phycisphaerales bacterium]